MGQEGGGTQRCSTLCLTQSWPQVTKNSSTNAVFFPLDQEGDPPSLWLVLLTFYPPHSSLLHSLPFVHLSSLTPSASSDLQEAKVEGEEKSQEGRVV